MRKGGLARPPSIAPSVRPELQAPAGREDLFDHIDASAQRGDISLPLAADDFHRPCDHFNRCLHLQQRPGGDIGPLRPDAGGRPGWPRHPRRPARRGPQTGGPDRRPAHARLSGRPRPAPHALPAVPILALAAINGAGIRPLRRGPVNRRPVVPHALPPVPALPTGADNAAGHGGKARIGLRDRQAAAIARVPAQAGFAIANLANALLALRAGGQGRRDQPAQLAVPEITLDAVGVRLDRRRGGLVRIRTIGRASRRLGRRLFRRSHGRLTGRRVRWAIGRASGRLAGRSFRRAIGRTSRRLTGRRFRRAIGRASGRLTGRSFRRRAIGRASRRLAGRCYRWLCRRVGRWISRWIGRRIIGPRWHLRRAGLSAAITGLPAAITWLATHTGLTAHAGLA